MAMARYAINARIRYPPYNNRATTRKKEMAYDAFGDSGGFHIKFNGVLRLF